MSNTVDFIERFRRTMHAAGVRFVITSGQACVYYGIQQTTRDSDWIIDPNDIDRLQELLVEMDESENWRVAYRAICGAPLSADYLQHGWTSHVVVTDTEPVEHSLDFFGKAPRVTHLERDAMQPDYASRHVVAQMKKTDREKDWPIVYTLGRQAMTIGDPRGILHGQDAAWLIDSWRVVPEDQRDELVRLRPVLRLIDREPHRLRRVLAIERQVWMSINRRRYSLYQRLWKEFFRRWRREAAFQWPLHAPFVEQNRRLADAARRLELPLAPLDDAARTAALAAARHEAAEIFAAAPEELDQIVPPMEVLLP